MTGSSSIPGRRAPAGRSAIFAGGPLYKDPERKAVDALRASGFTTVILWAVHVAENGDLSYNDTPITSQGTYTGDPEWRSRLDRLKASPTSINRLEISVGSGQSKDWANIRNLIAEHGTGNETVLYRNLEALFTATGADAINSDNEDDYDVDTAVRFARMAAAIGYKHFTLAPWTNEDYWKAVKDGCKGHIDVDRVYLQCYDGGSGNTPADWADALGTAIDPGLWCRHGDGCGYGDSPQEMNDQLTAWNSPKGTIPGGFVWLYDDIVNCEATTRYHLADYAQAINTSTGLGISTARESTRS